MKRCKLEDAFLKLCESNPQLVMKALSDRELMRPLLLRDHISYGGKLGTRGLASKYNINRSIAQRFLKRKKEEHDKDNSEQSTD